MIETLIKYLQSLEIHTKKYYPDHTFVLEHATSKVINIVSKTDERTIRLIYNIEKKILSTLDNKQDDTTVDLLKPPKM